MIPLPEGNSLSSDLVKHVIVNMGFPDGEIPDTSSASLLCQFQSTVPFDVLIHLCIQEVIEREWNDADKIILPCFMAKLYPLQDMHQVLPDSIPIDSFVASLVGRTSLAKEAVDKRVDGSLKKVYSVAHMALRAGIYGIYVAQSLISHLKSLCCALDESSDCTCLLELIQKQEEFFSDITFDVVRALAEGVSVSAHWNLVLRDWKMDAAQKSSAR
ncbi:hypothetical protein NDU88_002641 [Pleurodeles waltl]|uniref:Lamina-associated polypeptide 2 alpha C-terminal domain-containing protein n=1 Tax=Pleurodeles waltl TaxID=8319 RepID=A0AAV7T3X5_PLEWA|nr:hypothetical protein NDU88_002641 [Pleurodeles waltl]